MESQIIQAFLRILYTVNNNPQYILAKSSSQVSTIVCGGTTAPSQFVYAKAPLRACLAAICDSSPELLPQDPPRDFSIYVLDPLEAQPLPTSLVHTPHDTSSPPGVAVALGLMSWALESNDSPEVFVTGTIVPNASPALEVVFALREAKRMPKPMHRSHPSSGSTSTPLPYHPPNPPHAPQDAGMSSLSIAQEQRTLTRSADFPEFYIGPPRRAPGRPEGSTSKSKVKSQASASSLLGASSSRGVETRSDFKQEVGGHYKKKTKSRPPRAPPAYSPFICEPLTRSTATAPEASPTSVPFHTKSYPLGQNQTQPHSQSHTQVQQYLDATRNPLLQPLSTIPSTSTGNAANTTPEQHAALLAALQTLLTANPELLQLAATSMGSSASSGEQPTGNPMTGESKGEDVQDDGDSDIVILDSSTIDTTAFHRSGPRQFAVSDDTSPITTKQESPMPSVSSADSSPLPTSVLRSGQEGTPASSQTLTPKLTPETQTPASKQAYPGRTDERNIASVHRPEMPKTPSPSQTRKRKLDEYVQGEAYSSPPSPPPSPSPSVTCASSTALTAKRVLSSPMAGTQSMPSPAMRLPSVLSSIRSLAALGSRLQASSLGSSACGNWPPNKNENQSLLPGPSSSKADHSRSTDVPSNVASDVTLLKRRRTLNEVMEEREARKHTKARKRPSSGRKGVQVSANTSQAVPAPSAKVASTLKHAQSSPPRPLFRSEWMASLRPTTISRSGPAVIDPPATTPAATAPPKDSSTTGPTENPLKNFVMPAWARTETATLPRLSEEVLARQRAEQEAKKAQASMRRREAAKSKRKRLRATEHSWKGSSDEDEDAVANDPKLHASSVVLRGAPLLPPPPSLPVFASDAVEPIPSSPPRSHRQLVLPVVPSTPPRKSVSPGSAPHRTPSKSGSCSLFTPSGMNHGSLFTPSTPSVTRSLARVTATPRSPTVLHRPGAWKTPRKDVAQTPRTPKRNGPHHQTPRSLRSGRNASFGSPSFANGTPQSGMGTRTFLLPPPSPCTLRTPDLRNRARTIVPESSPPIVRTDCGTTKQDSPSDGQHVSRGKDALSREPDNISIASGPSSPTLPTVDETGEPGGMTHPNDVRQEDERYVSSPLPPSSPLPACPFSSPAKHHDSEVETPITDNLPDSDILLPSASDSDGSHKKVDTNWLSDDACAAAWFTESEASAWLTETEAWLTDTEGGGPLLTDSDGAWLSDSDAVFGDMSSLPPSSVSNWFSDDGDVDVDTDAEGGCRDGALDTVAFERAFVALVERGDQVQSAVGGHGDGSSAARKADADFWAAIRPLLGNALVDPSMASGGAVEENKFADDVREPMEGLVST